MLKLSLHSLRLGFEPGGNRALFGVIEEEKEGYSHSIGAKRESEGVVVMRGVAFSCAKSG